MSDEPRNVVYSRAYQRGKATADKLVAESRRETAEAHARAEAALTAAGVGRCLDCAAWRRGYNGPRYHDTINAEWGACGESLGSVSDPKPWFRAEQGPITTKPHFGCVLFRRRQSDGPAESTGE